jgi:hypothetical protein
MIHKTFFARHLELNGLNVFDFVLDASIVSGH